MFIFARCIRSSAAVTPAKYELDIIQVTTVFIIRKKWENNGTEKIALVTPTPALYQTVKCRPRAFTGLECGHHCACPKCPMKALLPSAKSPATASYRRCYHYGRSQRHQMELFSALLAICAGNSPVTGEFTAQRPVPRSFDIFFDLRLNKRLSKQSWGWWFQTLPRPLWRHCNDTGPRTITTAVLSDEVYVNQCWHRSMTLYDKATMFSVKWSYSRT